MDGYFITKPAKAASATQKQRQYRRLLLPTRVLGIFLRAIRGRNALALQPGRLLGLHGEAVKTEAFCTY